MPCFKWTSDRCRVSVEVIFTDQRLANRNGIRNVGLNCLNGFRSRLTAIDLADAGPIYEAPDLLPNSFRATLAGFEFLL
jgi:hypothetical protein